MYAAQTGSPRKMGANLGVCIMLPGEMFVRLLILLMTAIWELDGLIHSSNMNEYD